MLARVALAALFALPPLTAQAAVPIDAYGRLPAIESAKLSPDGSMVAIEETRNDDHRLSVVSIDSDKLLSGVRLGTAKVRSIEWADDDHLLITTASTQMPLELFGDKSEWNLLEVYDLKARQLRPLMANVSARVRTMNVVIGEPVIRRKGNDTLLFIHGVYVESRILLGLFEINLTTGAERIIKEGSEATSQWIVDDRGEIAAEQDYLEYKKSWVIRLYRDGKTTLTITGVAPIDPPRILGMSAAGDALIVRQSEPEGTSWKPLSVSDGTWGPDFRAASRSNEVLRARGSYTMIGTAFVDDVATFHFLDRNIQDVWDWIVRAFHHDRVEFTSMSDDHARMIVKVFGPASGYAYYFADANEHYTRAIGQIYPGVAKIAEVRKISYPAADGLVIPAYITLPPGREAKRLPLVALPHGGPQLRDRLDFNWWAQAIAAQGYAVLQPNFRGSNLDKKWIEAGYGEWGRKMQTDISDGVRYLAKEGLADPARVCIVGSSYGGYAALAGVALESGVYRCAVAVAGVSDPARLLVGTGSTAQRYWDRFLNVDGVNDVRLDAISPLKHAANVSVPVLLIHGKEDSTVPYEHSEVMAKALKRAKRQVEFVSLANEDHFLSMSQTRLQMLGAVTEFLRRNNPPE